MTDGYTAAQVRAAEAPLLAAGVPLMARAAAGLAKVITPILPQQGARVLLLVGGGNNGGDALFAGATLAAAGVDVAVIGTSERIHDDGLAAALAAGAHREPADSAGAIARTAHVIVDGILGTGTSSNPALRGTARAVVEAVLPVVREPKHPLVVAVDIPSGIDPDDGSVPDPVVLPADVTVTFGAVKAGLLRSPARELAGRVELVDIGIGEELARVAQPHTTTPTLPVTAPS